MKSDTDLRQELISEKTRFFASYYGSEAQVCNSEIIGAYWGPYCLENVGEDDYLLVKALESPIRHYDYWATQKQGYAVPWGHYNIEQLIEMKWIKINI